ncbi:hypothetical protein M0805_004700 [Coniferiporia weirii]|nr:hypothetical protein M0805_004700 [Coniferiporia weirii]
MAFTSNLNRGLLTATVVLWIHSLSVSAQTVQDIWETTFDQKSLLKLLPMLMSIFQLPTSDVGTYDSLLKSMFNTSANADSAGMNYMRVPLGASDFSPSVYSYNDNQNANFSIDVTPAYVFSTLEDIIAISNGAKIHLLPWSPPGWMKDSSSMNGGNFVAEYSSQMANYLFKSAQSFKLKGFTPYAISIQNEPQSSNPSLPSAEYTTSAQAAVAVTLRQLLNSNGMPDVKIIGYEHNWDNAASYATQLMRETGASDAFTGVAFHCYAGNVGQQDDFHNGFPAKELYFTECTGTVGSDWWNDIQFYMKNIFIGGLQHWAQSGLMWNIAVDPEGNPKLPGATSCGNGCRGVVQISSDGKVQLNQEYYAIAHASKAILPLSSGGPFGQRIGVGITGDEASSLTIGAYATNQTTSNPNSTGNERYSLVVMNSGNNALKAAIKFRGQTAVYSFPVGLTTMTWFASAS